MSQFIEERRKVFAAVGRLAGAGLMGTASGNVSCRIKAEDGDPPAGGLIAITASRIPYARFTVEDVLVVDFDVNVVVGGGVPSSESLCHVAAYRARPDVNAVVHSHSVYASAFAVAGQPIPAVLDEQVVTLGGQIDVAEYAPSASEALADAAVAALGDRAAVLLRHHGVLGVGADLDEACAVMELVERVAHVCLLSRSLGDAAELAADIVNKERAVYRMMKGFR